RRREYRQHTQKYPTKKKKKKCCNRFDVTRLYYNAIYVELCQQFERRVRCHRLPGQKDLEYVFAKHALTKEGQSRYESEHESYDSDQLYISLHKFSMFWTWFISCCHLMSELRHLWDGIDHRAIALQYGDYPPPPAPPSLKSSMSNGAQSNPVPSRKNSLLLSSPVTVVGNKNTRYNDSDNRNENDEDESSEDEEKTETTYQQQQQQVGQHVEKRKRHQTNYRQSDDNNNDPKNESKEDDMKSATTRLKRNSDGLVLKNSQSLPQAVQLDFFMTREFCEKVLQNCPKGTFTLRLSTTVPGGLVLSYYDKKLQQTSHILLTRIQKDQYLITGKQKTNASKTVTQKRVATSLSQLIRSFTKLKYVYTSFKIFPKKVLF
ncbi:hypothetical protein RFI_14747, partial [Reticulomyxa filosa]